ncbi:MAG: hypothetical protein ACR2RV_28650, partial [Verrucomicrobiales bacterium]
MKSQDLHRLAIALLLGLLLPNAAPGAGPIQTQSLNLQAGWNAVWLEVSPTISSGEELGSPSLIEDVFSNASIDAVARPVTPAGSTEFITDPEDTFNQEGWVVWHRDSTSGNSLTRVRGNQAYLIHNSGKVPVALEVTGSVEFHQPTWSAANYNLLGFSVSGSPTFTEFFGSAGEAGGVHPISKLQRMDPSSASWVGVQPGDTMSPGEAYWVFSERNSTFMGPVAIDIDGTDSINFGTGPGTLTLDDPSGNPLSVTTRELTLSNVDAQDHAVSLSKVTPSTTGPDADSDELRVYQITPVPDQLAYQLATGLPVSSDSLGTVPSLRTSYVTLGANRNWASGEPDRENLYRLEICLGSGGATQYFWLPMSAAREDLSGGQVGAADSSYAGLWVGQANINTVTSIAQAGNPAVATTSVLPLQIIIHVDSSGDASLLSHVLFMKTQSAGDGEVGEPVLVIDEEKIPFFQGVVERSGRDVGRRIETTAYDMPLLYVASAQPDTLLTIVGESLGKDPSEVTDADLETYVLAQGSRPAGFVGEYALSWPLQGGLGAGLTVGTGSDSPLNV